MSRIESIRTLLAASPDDTFLLYSLGMELFATDRPDEAAAQFDQVLQHDPDYLAAYTQMGRAMQAMGDHGGAAEILTRGIDVAERQGNRHAADQLRLLLSGSQGSI